MSYQIGTFNIEVKVKAPFLSAGHAPAFYGHDLSLYRNWQGKIAISGDQLRGVARHVLDELAETHAEKEVIKKYFGHKGYDANKDTNIDSEAEGGGRRQIHITDLILTSPDFTDGQNGGDTIDHHDMLTRIAINEETGAVIPGALIVYEQPFETNEDLTFKGEVAIWGEDIAVDEEDIVVDAKVAPQLVKVLGWAIRRARAVGLAKGAGFGQVTGVEITSTDPLKTIELNEASFERSACRLNLCLDSPLLADPMMLADNVFESRPFIPGSMLKGVLARHLQAAGLMEDVKDIFPKLTIRHALPVKPGSTDAVRRRNIPRDWAVSTQKVGLSLFDTFDVPPRTTHLSDVKYKDKPILQKDLGDVLFEGDVNRIVKTRTSIDQDSRQAKDTQLFVYHALSPEYVYTTDIFYQDETSCDNNKVQFFKIIDFIKRAGFIGLGKTGTIATVMETTEFSCEQLSESNQKTYIIELITDGCLLDGRAITKARDLNTTYESYFRTVLGDDARLVGFASDEYWRRPPNLQKHKSLASEEGYFPYLMTRAGSVFKIKTNKHHKIQKLQKTGLPLGLKGLTWQDCPFVADNGYGEVLICAV